MPSAPRPPHQVHIVRRLAPGGLESLVLSLLTTPSAHPELRRSVVSLEGSVEELIAAWPRLEAVRDRLVALDKAPGARPGLIPRLIQTLRRLDATACVTHGLDPLIYGGAAARLAGVRRRAHVDHECWSLIAPLSQRLHRAAMRLAQPHPIAVNDAVGAFLRLRQGLTPRILPIGVDCDRFRPIHDPAERRRLRRDFGLPEDAILVGAMGRLERIKGCDLLINALAHLPASVHVVLIGDGGERLQLEATARAQHLMQRTHFLGRVDDSPAALAACDLFCLPSRAEGAPLALLEAQAVGLPVIAADVGDVGRVLAPGAGALIPPEAPKALAFALNDLLSQGETTWMTMGAIGRSWMLRRHSFAVTQSAYETLALGASA